jgi:hypothetical protein
MKVKVKKSFSQKVTYDPKLDNMENKVKSPVKEQKFNEMLKKFGEKKISTFVSK